MLQKGYQIFKDSTKPYNLNIIGWRNKDGKVDRFDDFISIYWLGYDGKWNGTTYSATTLPGKPYIKNPLTYRGAAVLAPGQYKGAYSIGTHKTYEALVQVKPVQVYRDNNKNDTIECIPPIEVGMFGINIHKASILNKLVGLSSAGCQVIQNLKDYEEFMQICKIARDFRGNSFTYTLLEI